MSIIAWAVVGLIVGFVASRIANKTGEGVAMNVALGVVGALLGGWLFDQLGPRGAMGFSVWGLLMAGTFAAFVLMGYYTIAGSGERRV
jgi:uncharacterized membrane protein YeaQ/YmgE (transglycosylase-associated protein family)